MTNQNAEQKKISLLFSFSYLAVAAIGFSDSFYITIKYYLNSPVICSIVEGCDKVLSSPYAKIFDIPVALLGVIFYFSILILLLIYLKNTNRKLIAALFYLTLAGFLASLWFVYLQALIIKALCIYCIISAISSTALFILTLFYKKQIKNMQLP